MHRAAGILQRLAQVHQTAALRVERISALDELLHRLATRGVVAEDARMQLGIAAAEVIAVGLRWLWVDERAPEHELGAGLAQPIEVLGVIELERDVASDGDARARTGRVRV